MLSSDDWISAMRSALPATTPHGPAFIGTRYVVPGAGSVHIAVHVCAEGTGADAGLTTGPVLVGDAVAIAPCEESARVEADPWTLTGLEASVGHHGIHQVLLVFTQNRCYAIISGCAAGIISLIPPPLLIRAEDEVGTIELCGLAVQGIAVGVDTVAVPVFSMTKLLTEKLSPGERFVALKLESS